MLSYSNLVCLVIFSTDITLLSAQKVIFSTYELKLSFTILSQILYLPHCEQAPIKNHSFLISLVSSMVNVTDSSQLTQFMPDCIHTFNFTIKLKISIQILTDFTSLQPLFSLHFLLIPYHKLIPPL